MPNTKFYLDSEVPIVKSSNRTTKLVLSGDTVYMVTGLTQQQYDSSVVTWVVYLPTGSTTLLGPRLNGTYTPLNVYGYVGVSGTASINIYHGSTGSTTTLLSSDLSLSTSESSTTSFTASTVSSWLSLRIVSTSVSPPLQFVVCLALSRNF